ncbi:MAG: MBL fold metallo-hydrolase [Planctomycetota bacterium]
MKITLVESSVGPGPRQQILASYLINEETVIDAGSVGFFSPLEVQRRIRHVFLSHSHIDHIASLPILIDNVYQPGPDCPTIYASDHVRNCLQTDIFNDRLWPDMVRLSEQESPFLKFSEITSETAVDVGGLRVTPVSLDHLVPTFGFIVEDGSTAIAIVSDTSPTERVWEVINQTPNLKAVFLEASFPNDMEWLAERAMHLTPSLFGAEQAKLTHDVPVIAVHIKTAYDEKVKSELRALNLPRVEIAEPGRTYEFS